jgi:ATP-dependent DNA ligase
LANSGNPTPSVPQLPDAGQSALTHVVSFTPEGGPRSQLVSKRADAAYAPGNRGLWLKVKCLHREEFVVIGWTEPEGSRSYIGALLLGYYDPNGRLVYAGRVGSGINTAELRRLWRRLQPLATDRMPLDLPPPRSTRFGSPLVLSRVHWVRMQPQPNESGAQRDPMGAASRTPYQSPSGHAATAAFESDPAVLGVSW